MSTSPCLARIRGIPTHPSITEINVRSGPGTHYEIAFKGRVGLDDIPILEVRPDELRKNLNGKIYQWFKLAFQDGTTGWIRDDLLDISGDCQQWGYGVHPPETFAFALQRRQDATSTSTESPGEAASTDSTSAPTGEKPVLTQDMIQNVERIRAAAFAITKAFEGSGYAAFNNHPDDRGIVSYGFLQFTLASGNLFTVVDNYLRRANSPTANELRAFHRAISSRDPALRNDPNLRRLLIAAADDPIMRQVQDEVATQNFWDRTIQPFVIPRGFRHPLTFALLFDVSVNFGVGDLFVRRAEANVGVAARSRIQDTGVTEESIIADVVQQRKISHDRQAERDNMPGLRVRGDFWVDLVTKGDWNLLGDAQGFVVANGHRVQVANPE